jgi:hypothetical protein
MPHHLRPGRELVPSIPTPSNKSIPRASLSSKAKVGWLPVTGKLLALASRRASACYLSLRRLERILPIASENGKVIPFVFGGRECIRKRLNYRIRNTMGPPFENGAKLCCRDILIRLIKPTPHTLTRIAARSARRSQYPRGMS